MQRAKIDDVLQELKALSSKRVDQLDAAKRSPKSLYYPRHNENFVGRHDDLLKLRDALAASSEAVISAVNGLGGVGKTELALTYGHAFAWDYELGRLFVRCEGKKSLRSVILSEDLTRLIGLIPLEGNEEEKYAQLWERLRTKHNEIVARNVEYNETRKDKQDKRDLNTGSHLYLVLDNVTLPELASQAELDQLPEFVHAVITTRKPIDRFYHLPCRHTLDVLPKEDALKLLENFRSFKNPKEEEAAEKIVELLGGFTLAIAIVGSYLKKNTFETYQKYAARLVVDIQNVLDETTADGDLQLANGYQTDFIECVLAPTFDALNKNAKELLQVASLFAPDAIPLPWLGEILGLDDHDAEVGIFELENYGLLTPVGSKEKDKDGAATLARLHRLVREQIHKTLSPEFCDSIKQAIRVKSKETLEGDANAFFQPGADWSLTAIFEFYLELASDQKDSSRSEIDGNLIWTLGTLGQLFQRFGRMSQARTAFCEGKAICRHSIQYSFSQSELATFESNLGDLKFAEGDTKKARDSYQKALDMRRLLVKYLYNDVQALRDLNISFEKLGDLALAEGDTKKAKQCYHGALNICCRLVESLPGDVQALRDLSVSFNRLGELERIKGNMQEAGEDYQSSLEITLRLAESLPNDVQVLRDLSVLFNRLGELEHVKGNVQKAREYYQNSLAKRSLLAKSLPNDVQAQRDLNYSFNKLGNLEYKFGTILTYRTFFEPGVAHQNFAKALDISQKLVNASPTVPLYQLDWGENSFSLGDSERALGNLNEARACYERALETFESTSETAFQVAYHREMLSLIYRNLGDLDAEEGDFEAARAHWENFAELAERTAAEFPDQWKFQGLVNAAIYRRSLIALRDGNVGKANELFHDALERCEKLVEQYPDSAVLDADLKFLHDEEKSGKFDLK